MAKGLDLPMLRETAPLHDLDETQRAAVRTLLDSLENRVGILREELTR